MPDNLNWTKQNQFQENQFDRSNSLAYTPYKDKVDDDVTELVTVDKASCQCAKVPPHCDCCAQFKVAWFPVKGNVFWTVGCSDVHNQVGGGRGMDAVFV